VLAPTSSSSIAVRSDNTVWGGVVSLGDGGGACLPGVVVAVVAVVVVAAAVTVVVVVVVARRRSSSSWLVVVVVREGLRVAAVAVVSRGSAVVLCIACRALK
jgi:hypothetical protein